MIKCVGENKAFECENCAGEQMLFHHAIAVLNWNGRDEGMRMGNEKKRREKDKVGDEKWCNWD